MDSQGRDIDSLLERMRALWLEGRSEEAARICGQCLALYPENLTLLKFRAQFATECEDLDDYIRAAERVREVVGNRASEVSEEYLPLVLQESDAPKSEVLFISGVARSGTTALGQLLNLSGETAIFVERYRWLFGYHPAMFLDRYLYAPGWEKGISARQWAGLRGTLNDVRYVGDKRPNFILSWQITKNNFDPEKTKIIHLHRNISDIAWSYNRRARAAALGTDKSWEPTEDFRFALRDFNNTNRQLLRALSQTEWRNSFLVVDYDSMFRDFECCGRVLEWLSLRVSRELESRIRDFINQSAAVLARERVLPRDHREYIQENVDGEALSAVEKHCLNPG